MTVETCLEVLPPVCVAVCHSGQEQSAKNGATGIIQALYESRRHGCAKTCH